MITKDDFLDLNEKIGGYDINTKWQAANGPSAISKPSASSTNRA